MVLNFTVASVFWAAMFGTTLALTVPFIPVAQVVVGSIAILTGLPIWFYPRSKMLWAAIEFLTSRSEPDYHTPTARDPQTRGLE
jgi:hypothetical protein